MTPGPEYTDFDLVASGNEPAFHALYDQYAPKVYAMAKYYLKSSLEAQDIVQEVFVKVWEHRHELPEIKNFPAWLRTITRNHLINTLQKKIPARFQLDLAGHEPAADAAHPNEQLDYKEMAGIVQEAVKSLPPRQQQVYRLSREQAFTLNEIAAELGISCNTVREHMGAALRSIRDQLEARYGALGLLIFLLFRH